MARTVDVTDLMDLPETGGRGDEIGGHVARPADDHPRIECPDCGATVWTDATGHGCVDGFRHHPAGSPGVSSR